MYKKGIMLLSTLIIIPSISNINTNAIDNTNGPQGIIESNNFKFQYKTYLMEEVNEIPFQKINDSQYLSCKTQISYKFNYPNIDYKDLFMENINYNYHELMEYRKELIYFVEISGNYEDDLVFHDPTRYNVDIIVDIDGIENKFGYYLMTINSNIIYKRKMIIEFTIDDNIYHIEFEYNDYSGIYYKLNYFETAKELDDFCDKYGL